MDLPAPPTEIRNIIDKLAPFVARNGPEFESITKAKQQGNPKFSFLYGGDYYAYYQWRVSSEQAILKQQGSISQENNLQTAPAWLNAVPSNSNGPKMPPQQQQQQAQHQQMQQQPPPSQANPHGGPPNNPTEVALHAIGAQLDAMQAQQNTLREQIKQSEQNLTAQHGVLMAQQQAQIDEAIVAAQRDSLIAQASDQQIDLGEFDGILQPIVDACTKDSIQAGKNWILQHTTDSAKCNVLLQYLLKKYAQQNRINININITPSDLSPDNVLYPFATCIF